MTLSEPPAAQTHGTTVLNPLLLGEVSHCHYLWEFHPTELVTARYTSVICLWELHPTKPIFAQVFHPFRDLPRGL